MASLGAECYPGTANNNILSLFGELSFGSLFLLELSIGPLGRNNRQHPSSSFHLHNNNDDTASVLSVKVCQFVISRGVSQRYNLPLKSSQNVAKISQRVYQ